MTENRSADAILENLKQIRGEIRRTASLVGRNSHEIQIMAVTKTIDAALVNTAIHAGVSLLGENRVQEFLQKEDDYDLSEAKVHFIGTLQTNKVKYIIDKVTMIESVSSLRLAKEIEKQAEKRNLVMDVLLEVNIGEEESKSGFLPNELFEALQILSKLSHLHICGLMCIPPKVNAAHFFCKIEQLFIDIGQKNIHNVTMDVLSMGMSSDYKVAIAHGATTVRLGNALFGTRPQKE